MLIPDFLYRQPLSKDRATQQIEILSRSIQTTGSAGLVQSRTIFTLPADRIGVLTMMSVSIVQGGGTDALVTMRGFASGVGFVASGSPQAPFTPPSTNIMSWTGQVWLPPSSLVIIDAIMSAMSVGAVLDFTAQAITFPRGNIAVA